MERYPRYTSDYEFMGQSVSANDSARFFSDRFRDFATHGSVCSALTLDGVDKVRWSDVRRLNSTWVQSMYDKGLADSALSHGFPMRVDQESPSDILASVAYGARTVARLTSDADPSRTATSPDDHRTEHPVANQRSCGTLFERNGWFSTHCTTY